METHITLSELSAMLCATQKETDLRKTSRKIQNWVTDGIVQPVGGKNEGRGVHRKYDKFESYKIAVLLEATRFRLPGVVLQMLSSLFDDSRPTHQKLKNKMGRRLQSSSKTKAANNFNQLITRACSNKIAYMSLTPCETDNLIQVNFSTSESFIKNNSSAIVLNLTMILSNLASGKT